MSISQAAAEQREHAKNNPIVPRQIAASSEATAIEQARAIAEVQAAVVVAQQVPRDIERATAEMQHTCGRVSFAKRAFYSVRNRGEGASVHMARELARIFGNMQYGVTELRRDDVRGESEIAAWAWDVERNTRSTRTFIVPHVRMAGGRRQPLTDVQDIYLSNQNIGARAVRECIFAQLPTWFVDEAKMLARNTVERGADAGANEVSLADRVKQMTAAFAKGGVSEDMLVRRVGKPVASFDAQDVASLTVLFESLRQRETTVEDEFPAQAQSITEAAAEKAGEA